MNSSNDNDLFDTMSLIDADISSDFEIVDYDTESEGRPFAHSSAASEIASSLSDATESLPPSPQLDASQFHFPDPEDVFDRVTLDSSSLHTLMATSQQQIMELSTRQHALESSDMSQMSSERPDDAVPACALGHVTKEQETDKIIVEAPPQSFKRIILETPKSVWLVLLLTTFLISIKTSSLLSPQSQIGQRRDGTTRYEDTRWITKFASPAPTAQAPFSNSRAANSLPRADPAFAIATKHSSSSLSLVDKAASHRGSHQSASASTSKPRTDQPQHRDTSVALQETPSASKKGLTVVGAPSAKMIGCQRGVKEPKSPEFRRTYQPRRKLRRPYESCSACRASKVNWDRMILSMQAESAYLANATTTTWDFWLGELQSYHQLVLRPAIVAARQQAIEAARAARRYHQEQLVSAFASLRQHAKRHAQQMEDFANRYNDEQVRPAFAFARDQAAEYHDKVLTPAVKQFRQQAAEAAKMTSQGLSKAAKRFSSEAADTVRQVKDATNLDLEAIGVDEYLGFMISTIKGLQQNL